MRQIVRDRCSLFHAGTQGQFSDVTLTVKPSVRVRVSRSPRHGHGVCRVHHPERTQTSRWPGNSTGRALGHAEGHELPSPPDTRNGEPRRPPKLVSHPMHRARAGIPPDPDPINSLNRICSGADSRRRSLSRARGSAENRHRREPSRGHPTRPPLRSGTATSGDTSPITFVLSIVSRRSRLAPSCRSSSPLAEPLLPEWSCCSSST